MSNYMREIYKELGFSRCRTRDLELELQTVPRDPPLGVRRNRPQFEVEGDDWFFQNDLQVRSRLNGGAYDRPLRDGRVHDGFSDVIHGRRPVHHVDSHFQLRQPAGPLLFPLPHEVNHLFH